MRANGVVLRLSLKTPTAMSKGLGGFEEKKINILID